MSKFLLLLGPSGVGKSVVINELLKIDDRFIYISPYMTRPIRLGEDDKIMVSDIQMNEMMQRGELLVVNKLFNGIRYGTPKLPIEEALASGNFPVLDWPIDRLEIMTRAFSQLFVVYIAPPSIDVLRQRLTKDGRDIDGSRLANAERELNGYWSHKYKESYDMEVVSEDNKASEIATIIYTSYLKSFEDLD